MKMVADDGGSESIEIPLPNISFQLFENTVQAYASQVLYLRIPNSDMQDISTKQIRAEFNDIEKVILQKAAKERQLDRKQMNLDDSIAR